MNILFVSNKYVPESNGGAERSMRELVEWAVNIGHKVSVITLGNHDTKTEKLTIKRLLDLSEPKLRVLLTEFKPDVCVCQLDWTPITVNVCNSLKVPVIHSSRVGDFNKNADAWLFNNKRNAEYWASRFSLPHGLLHVCYPLVRPQKKRFFIKEKKKFITIVNPVLAKGGEILEKIAKRFPDEIFIAIHGWHDPQLDGVNLSLPNIIYLDRQKNMDMIFEQTKILLVPSVWEDPSPRVILEAAHYRIPLVASNKGGIPEFVHDEDMLFDIGNTNKAYALVNDLIHDKQFYENKKNEMSKIAKRFDPDRLLPDTLLFIESVKCKNNYMPGYEQEFVNMEWFKPRHENL